MAVAFRPPPPPTLGFEGEIGSFGSATRARFMSSEDTEGAKPRRVGADFFSTGNASFV